MVNISGLMYHGISFIWPTFPPWWNGSFPEQHIWNLSGSFLLHCPPHISFSKSHHVSRQALRHQCQAKILDIWKGKGALSFSFFRDGFCYVVQAGLKRLSSSDPPAWASQSAGITGMSHWAGPQFLSLNDPTRSSSHSLKILNIYFVKVL